MKDKKTFGVKTLAALAAVALALGCVIGGTMAWLTAESDAVVNTFTKSDINITLTETKGGPNHEFKMIPGWSIEKDPTVTVEDGSEDCFLFVQLTEGNNFDSFMTYTMEEGWTQLKNVEDEDVEGVFYRKVKKTDTTKTFGVLKDDQVQVLSTVTKTDMSGLNSSVNPTLTVQAYASQLYKNNNATDNEFTPLEAWNNISNPSGAITE